MSKAKCAICDEIENIIDISLTLGEGGVMTFYHFQLMMHLRLDHKKD